MKSFFQSLWSKTKTAFSALQKRIRIFNKRLRKRMNRDRDSRTRLAYIGLSFGTVALAYLLVLINMGVFRLAERNLYDKEQYEATSIISAGRIGEPLSRAVRVDLYRTCTIEGKERATLPEERTEEQALQQIRSLWEQTLSAYADNGYLRTGESVDRILSNSKYTAKLRDFYNEETGAKLALWGTQAYFTASGGLVYCLSAELDSRTEDVYSMTVALYGNIDGSDPVSSLTPMLNALGESLSVTDGLIVSPTEYGSLTTLTFSDGVRLCRYTYPGTQVYLTLQ